mmetsp:Transcript_99186/g.285307  ORF Transcript_99186/g.285307 Transcript_99186/m.285307 type:complete len:243 (-) Transcript_99186:1040-1768(-)
MVRRHYRGRLHELLGGGLRRPRADGRQDLQVLPDDVHHRQRHVHAGALQLSDVAGPCRGVGQEDDDDERWHEVLGLRPTSRSCRRCGRRRFALLPQLPGALHTETVLQVREHNRDQAGDEDEGRLEVLDLLAYQRGRGHGHGQRAEGDVLDAAAALAIHGLPQLHVAGCRWLQNNDLFFGIVCRWLHPSELRPLPESQPLFLFLRALHEEGRVLAVVHVLHAPQRLAALVHQLDAPAGRSGS